ncbi:conserved hypothetical protein [Bacillus subtilis]
MNKYYETSPGNLGEVFFIKGLKKRNVLVKVYTYKMYFY